MVLLEVLLKKIGSLSCLMSFAMFVVVQLHADPTWKKIPYKAYTFSKGRQVGRLFLEPNMYDTNKYYFYIKGTKKSNQRFSGKLVDLNARILTSPFVGLSVTGDLYAARNIFDKVPAQTMKTFPTRSDRAIVITNNGKVVAATTTSGDLYVRGVIVENRVPLIGEVDDSVVLVNHVGFMLRGRKNCLLKGSLPLKYSVVNAVSGKEEYSDTLRLFSGRDFGSYVVGDFSKFRPSVAGVYRIQTSKGVSQNFRIADDVYDDAIKKMLRYFALQRCGPAYTGWHGACHQTDGKMLIDFGFFKEGNQIDAKGGWHDACDVLKFTTEHLGAVMAIEAVEDLIKPLHNRSDIYGELKWGSDYCLKMRDPTKSLYYGITSNNNKRDNNNWTNPRRPDGIRDVLPLAPLNGDGAAVYDYGLSTLNTADNPNSWYENRRQSYFIGAEASASLLAKRSMDKGYATKTKDYCVSQISYNNPPDGGKPVNPGGPFDYSCAIQGYLRAYRVTMTTSYLNHAATFADRLIAHQDTGPYKYFRWWITERTPTLQPSQLGGVSLSLLALCELVQEYRNAGLVPKSAWITAIENYSRTFVLEIANRNAFHLVPWNILINGDTKPNELSQGRRLLSGDYYYRYFRIIRDDTSSPITPDLGLNLHVACFGLGLIKASKIFRTSKPLFADSLERVGQRQIDWIMGCNPFNSSMIEMVGYNQPTRYISSQIYTPLLPGAVINGFTSDVNNDRPYLADFIFDYAGTNLSGSVPSCEYWTWNVVFTMWLAAEIKATDFSGTLQSTPPFYYYPIYY